MSSQTGEINHDPVEDDNGARLSDQREDGTDMRALYHPDAHEFFYLS